MDVVSYLLGKNASGGGGGSTIYPYSISFRDNENETIDLSNVNFSSYGSNYFDDIFRNCYNVKELHFNSLSKSFSSCKYTFYRCRKLETANFDVINLGGVTSLSNLNQMFTECYALNDDSLNKILLMCASATQLTGTKALRNLSIPVDLRNKISENPQNYSNYQTFINAGWTIE